ncbi:CaiB/BaiF CoA transferase family protein [Steroidobacter sp.]|uniref:CaiB/BaiF CoA transferase family protein n=1 Tax=Steroidobacter sp. TaxID=1978227 RepID=UPI001A570E47|nr:CaiB/BaiF CoA-transferase family protein [Steroidobacter sp.]MBL8266565.1 CoA transferase [Steroidobacter sp.]
MSTAASSATTPLPLQGVKVLELGSLIAGPYAAALFAQFGADVIKIEPPGQGDPLRKWRKLHQGTSLWWYAQSRNKKSVVLDLKSEEGRDIVRQLAAEADIVVENFRPGTLEQWGIGWEQLSAINPGLIMVRISGYGQSGPRRDLPGFAAIAEAMGGLRFVTGFPDRPPVRSGVSIGDTLASLYGALGAMVALHHRNTNGGKGQVVDVALYEAVFGVMESLMPEFSAQGFVRERSGASLPGISPSNTYECGDGQHAVIAGNGDALFKRLMQAIGRNDLGTDPALAHNDGRVRRNDELDAAIGAWTAQRGIDEVVSVLERAEVPVGKIYSAADIATDEHYKARGMLEQHTLADGQQLTLPGIVPKLSATPGRTRWLGPTLGEHTSEVLAGLGAAAKESKR